MKYITLTRDNIEAEHICCAISNNRDIQVSSKKAWLRDRLDEGLVFIKAEERGKCFIEYLPAEMAWAPVVAPGYMYIDCLWVSGSFKGHGYSSELLEKCIDDSIAKGKKGICVLSSQKGKMGFLSDPAFLTHKSFKVADTAEPNFALMYLPLEEGAVVPRFGESVRRPSVQDEGYVIYYTNQCPFTAKYVPLLAQTAEEKKIPLKVVKIDSRKTAQEAPLPFTTFSLFRDGQLVTHEILSVPKFLKITGAV